MHCAGICCGSILAKGLNLTTSAAPPAGWEGRGRHCGVQTEDAQGAAAPCKLVLHAYGLKLYCVPCEMLCWGHTLWTLTCFHLQAAAKRYKITGSGKVLTRRPGKQHINEKKSPKRLRALGKEKEIDHGDKRKVVRCLPYADIA